MFLVKYVELRSIKKLAKEFYKIKIMIFFHLEILLFCFYLDNKLIKFLFFLRLVNFVTR